jgi:hypothetical protein
MAFIKSWVSENPYLKGINWYSNIEVNIRLLVWYFCWQILWDDESLKRNKELAQFTEEIWLPTIYDHCIYSHSNPSRYSSANNHLISEYSGLFVAAIAWPFQESSNWLNYAQKGLEKEIIEQHSSNGINKEEAAEYIQFITDFFLIPFAVGKKHKIEFSDTYKTQLYKTFDYILNLLDVKGGYIKYGDEDDGKVLVVDPDPHSNNFLSLLTSGTIIFKDSNFKKSKTSFDLKNWLLFGEIGKNIFANTKERQQELQSTFYTEEGHFFFRKASNVDPSKEIYLHFDAAPLGYLSIAAHGHADALSVVLTLDGDPILVDAGTYTYHTEKQWRKYFVSTLAHNTMCIDNANQAGYVGPTMWLEHYNVDVTNTLKGDVEIVSAKHSGYKKIRCTHSRTVKFNRAKDEFIITDEVNTDFRQHSINQLWHLHPAVVVERINDHSLTLKHSQGTRKVKVELDSSLTIKIIKGETEPINGWFSKSFLLKEPTIVISCIAETNKPITHTFTTLFQVLSDYE